jgi:type IV fimbrial biogenesis protein FimT
MRPRVRGFSVIELMITVAVFAFLLVAGVPTMRGVIENGRIRAAGEAFKSGLTLARTEAIRRNARVEFLVEDDGWQVSTQVAGATVVLHEGAGSEGQANLALTIAPDDADRVTFDPFGRVMDPNPDDSEPITQIDFESVTPPTASGYRPLQIQVLGSGAARLCDPAVPDTDARACL